VRLVEYRDEWHGKTAVWLDEQADRDVYEVSYLPNFPLWIISAVIAGILLALWL
jgi:hypothetical protein